MDEIERTSLSGNPAHGKYKRSVFLQWLTMLWRVSTARCVSWGMWLALGCCRDLLGACLLCSVQMEATGACGWAPDVPGAGLPGWQSPGEVTPVCQNLPAPDRELPLPRGGPYPLLCHVRQDSRKESHLLKVEEGSALFLPSLPFPSWMNPAILGMPGM